MSFLESIKKFFLDFDNKEPFNTTQDVNVVLVGLVIVFVALLLLSFIISLFSYIFKERSNKEEKKDPEKESLTKATVKDDAKAGEMINKEVSQDEEELIAVLTAAIMASYGKETSCKLKVTSFKRVSQASSPAWNAAGRRDSLDSSL